MRDLHTAAYIRELLSHIDDSRAGALILPMTAAGFRIGDVLGLRADDVDVENKAVKLKPGEGCGSEDPPCGHWCVLPARARSRFAARRTGSAWTTRKIPRGLGGEPFGWLSERTLFRKTLRPSIRTFSPSLSTRHISGLRELLLAALCGLASRILVRKR